MNLVKRILIIGGLFALGSCAQPDLKMTTQMIEPDHMFDKKVFIEQAKPRAEDEAAFGPLIDTSQDATLREDSRTHVITENPPNYDALDAMDNTEVFPIDLHIENLDIRTLASMMAELTGLNFLVSDEVDTTVTARINNVPWVNALDSILQMKTLAKHVDTTSGIVRIHDQDTIMRIEDFERKRQENMQKALLLKQASEPMYTEIFKLFYTNPQETRDMLLGILNRQGAGASLPGIRNTNPEITINPRQNILIVKARKDDMDLISKLIESLDTRTKQIFIEAFIVEVTDDFQHALGSRLGFNARDNFSITDSKLANVEGGGIAASGSGVNSTNTTPAISELPLSNAFGGLGFLAGIGDTTSLKLELSAMEKEGLTKVISNPKIFTLDNKEALIFQGVEIPYSTVSQEGTQVQFKEAGLKLTVKPSVIGDGNLLMDIAVNKDTADTSQPEPPIRKSEIRTSLISRDGSIVVIGGIYDENKSDATDKLPGLGDIPGVGKLFKRENKNSTRRELMVFIAPRIL